MRGAGYSTWGCFGCAANGRSCHAAHIPASCLQTADQALFRTLTAALTQAATPAGAVAADEFTFETAAPAAPAENGPPAAAAGAIPDDFLAAGGEVGRGGQGRGGRTVLLCSAHAIFHAPL